MHNVLAACRVAEQYDPPKLGYSGMQNTQKEAQVRGIGVQPASGSKC